MDRWVGGSQWRVKRLVRRNKVCLLLDNRSLSGVTCQPVHCLAPSTKLTYIRLTAQILLCCSGCQRTVLRLMLHTMTPKCIIESLIVGLLGFLLFTASAAQGAIVTVADNGTVSIASFPVDDNCTVSELFLTHPFNYFKA